MTTPRMDEQPGARPEWPEVARRLRLVERRCTALLAEIVALRDCAVPRAKRVPRRRLIEVDGVTKSMSEWARHFGVATPQVIAHRLKKGWPPRDAVSTPPLSHRDRMFSQFANKPKEGSP